MRKSNSISRRRLLQSLSALPVVAACSVPDGKLSTARRASTRAAPALLLPLSGSNAALGQQMAKAVWLDEDLNGRSGRTIVLDAGDSPAKAAEATRRAVKQGANIIVGPLFRVQTPAVVNSAGNVPVMTLSNDNSMANSGAWVFGVTPAQSADAVLRYARQNKVKHIAILDSGAPVSQRAFQTLSQGARKARVARVDRIAATSDPAETVDILRLAGEGVLPGILYVPTSNEKAQTQAISAVKAGITTIGSLQWSNLSQEALRQLDKACYTGPDPLRFNRLSAAYQSQLDEKMGVIAALTVDAISLANEIGGRARLDRKSATEGLLGSTRFNADRTLQRSLSILRINNGNIERVA